MKRKQIWEQKTSWTAALMIATVLIPLFGISGPVLEGIRTVIIGLALIFARQAIENSKPE